MSSGLKLLFLDWDGPISNFRQIFNRPTDLVDPAAVGLVNALTAAGFKTVVSATLRVHHSTPDSFVSFAAGNGMQVQLYPEWKTAPEMIPHSLSILNFLFDHRVNASEIVILDDESCTEPSLEPYWYKCDTYDGVPWDVIHDLHERYIRKAALCK